MRGPGRVQLVVRALASKKEKKLKAEKIFLDQKEVLFLDRNLLVFVFSPQQLAKVKAYGWGGHNGQIPSKT